MKYFICFFALLCSASAFTLKIVNTTSAPLYVELSGTFPGFGGYVGPNRDIYISPRVTGPSDINLYVERLDGSEFTYGGATYYGEAVGAIGSEPYAEIMILQAGSALVTEMDMLSPIPTTAGAASLVEYFLYGFGFVFILECGGMARRMAGKIATQSGGEV